MIPEIRISDSARRLRTFARAIELGDSITDIALRLKVPVSSLRAVCFPKVPRSVGRPRNASDKPSVQEIALTSKARQLEGARRLRHVADAIQARESVTDVAIRMGAQYMALRNLCLPRARQYVGAPRAISDELVAEAIFLARAGKTTKEIAERLHVNLWTISRALSKADAIPMLLRAERMKKAVKLYKQGTPPQKLMKKFGVSKNTLYVHLRKAGVSQGRRQMDKTSTQD